MMSRYLHLPIALVLVLCIVGISGLAPAQTVLHESQHSHHQSATHSTVLCSWMCAAGHMLDGLQFLPQTRFDLLALNLVSVFRSPFSHPVESPTSRGPPVFSI